MKNQHQHPAKLPRRMHFWLCKGRCSANRHDSAPRPAFRHLTGATQRLLTLLRSGVSFLVVWVTGCWVNTFHKEFWGTRCCDTLLLFHIWLILQAVPAHQNSVQKLTHLWSPGALLLGGHLAVHAPLQHRQGAEDLEELTDHLELKARPETSLERARLGPKTTGLLSRNLV